MFDYGTEDLLSFAEDILGVSGAAHNEANTTDAAETVIGFRTKEKTLHLRTTHPITLTCPSKDPLPCYFISFSGPGKSNASKRHFL